MPTTNFHDYSVDVVKQIGQELIDRAEELVPNTENVKDLSIWIRIPSISETLDLPEIQVDTTVYPNRFALSKIFSKHFGCIEQ